MRKSNVWITEDGASFTNQKDAEEHEFVRALANELIMQLKMNTQTADTIARNLKEVNRVAQVLRKEMKNEAHVSE